MKKVILSLAAALALSVTAASAADMPVKAVKAPAPPPSPWDIAFGAAFTTDYELRGVSQSDHHPAAQGYFEIDYTATDWLKFYAGVWGSSLWTGFADAEFDITGGARLSWSNFGLDIGYIYYAYPGGINTLAGLANGSYGEMYVKPSYKFTDWLTVGGIFETGFNNFNGKKVVPFVGGALANGIWTGDAKHYFYAVNAVITLPWQPMGVTMSVNPEIGYEYYSSGITTNYGPQSDTYWDVGLVLNYKAVTLDLRYWGINLSPNATAPLGFNQCGPGGAGQNFCGDRFVATLKFDTSLSALK
jgi:uncharacterized protein (TIGR02001 family)